MLTTTDNDTATMLKVLETARSGRALVMAATPKYGCLMAMLPALDSTLPNWAADNIKNDTLAADGIEMEPHVTVLYGFDTRFVVDRLRKFLDGHGPVTVKLGPVSRFECDDYDVLKLSVESSDLRALNAALANEFQDDVTVTKWVTGSGYNPHVTIAYVQKGTNGHLDGATDFAGREYTLSQLLHSLPDNGPRRVIELTGGEVKAEDATPEQPSHHESARRIARRIWKAALDGWLAQLEADLVSALFGHRAGDYDGVWSAVYGAAAGGWVGVVADASRRARLATAAALGRDAGVDLRPTGEALDAFTSARTSALLRFPEAVRDKVAASVKRGVAGGEDARALARRVQESFAEIEQGSAVRAADTEAQVAYGVSQSDVLEMAGFSRKRWVTVGDDRVRDSHYLCEAQGAIPVGQVFHNRLRFPGDPNGDASEVINCRCNLEGEA